MSRAALLAAAAALAACDTGRYLAGTLDEDAGRPARALAHYEAFLARRPGDPRSCEVRLRAARLYRDVFGRCGEARRHLEAAARGGGPAPCPNLAAAGLLSCPDYFPLDPGRVWVLADSLTGGRAMRRELEVLRSTGPAAQVSAALYAGDRRLRVEREAYAKEDWAVWRLSPGRAREPLLRYPYAPGQRWRGGGTPALEYEVVTDSAVVRTAAGEFRACLKVRQSRPGRPSSWRYDYYAPGVGLVKTTAAGPGYESPNSELARFDKIP